MYCRRQKVHIEHVAMYVQDLEKTRQFYEMYFGAKSNDMYYNKITGFKSYFLTFKMGSRLEIMTAPNLTEKSSNNKSLGFIHLAFSMGSKEKVLELTERLRDDGFEICSEPRTTGDGYFESCVCDPEGNLVEITV